MFSFPWWHPEAIHNALVCYLVHLYTYYPLLGPAALFRLAPCRKMSTVPCSFVVPCYRSSLFVSNPSSHGPPNSAVAYPFFRVLGVVQPRLSLQVLFLRNLAASIIVIALCPDYTSIF